MPKVRRNNRFKVVDIRGYRRDVTARIDRHAAKLGWEIAPLPATSGRFGRRITTQAGVVDVTIPAIDESADNMSPVIHYRMSFLLEHHRATGEQMVRGPKMKDLDHAIGKIFEMVGEFLRGSSAQENLGA